MEAPYNCDECHIKLNSCMKRYHSLRRIDYDLCELCFEKEADQEEFDAVREGSTPLECNEHKETVNACVHVPDCTTRRESYGESMHAYPDREGPDCR
jgi:hypothetical protein